jgi:hypothetical protein
LAIAGTFAVIFTDETTVKVADTLPSLTEVAPVKPDPLIVIVLPVQPYVGEKLVIFGPAAAVTVNVPVLVPVPLPFVTETFPVVAPLGTVAVIFTVELTV